MIVCENVKSQEVKVNDVTKTVCPTDYQLNAKSGDKKLSSFKKVFLSIFTYLAIGELLSLSYSWAADGNVYVKIFGPIFFPAFIVILIVTGLSASLDKPETSKFKFIDTETIFLILLLTLPIFLKYFSKIFTIIGSQRLAEFVYNQRFSCLIYLIILFILYLLGKKIISKS